MEHPAWNEYPVSLVRFPHLFTVAASHATCPTHRPNGLRKFAMEWRALAPLMPSDVHHGPIRPSSGLLERCSVHGLVSVGGADPHVRGCLLS